MKAERKITKSGFCVVFHTYAVVGVWGLDRTGIVYATILQYYTDELL